MVCPFWLGGRMMGSPIYIQIHNQLRSWIEAGKWSVGTRIPAERTLANEFGVSRMTLRQAIQTLVDEGVLERRAGSGTYVANQKVQEKMTGVTSFTELMQAIGKQPSSKTLAYYLTVPSQTEVTILNLQPGERILRMERIRYGDNVPICFEVATVPEKLVQNFSRSEMTQSFYQTLAQKAALYPGRAVQTISATNATERIAEYLNIKRGDALLSMHQTSYLQDGRPFEYVHTQYVGNLFEFVLEK